MTQQEVPPTCNEADFSLERILTWMMTDPCFDTLTTLSIAYELLGSQERSDLVESVRPHVDACGSCFSNVRGRSVTAEDPIERFAYGHLADGFCAAWLRQGGSITSKSTSEGRYSLVTFAADLKTPYRGMEVFEPHEPNTKGYVRLYADSAELLRSPGQVLQHLDVVTTNQVQTYGPETGDLHWQPIFSEHEYRVLVHHGEEEVEVATGWTLHSRYGDLVRYHLSEDERRSEMVGDSSQRAFLGHEVETIEAHALKYESDRSNFAGYFKRLLTQREIDRYRSASRDPMKLDSELAEEEDRADGDDPAKVREASDIGDRSMVEVCEKLRPHLDEQQVQILNLKIQGFSDAEIGRKVGWRRETINRKLREIKQLAKDLLK